MKGSQIHFWDLGGQRDLQPMWSKYYTDCHGIIFVIDATARNRLQQVQEAFGNWSELFYVRLLLMLLRDVDYE